MTAHQHTPQPAVQSHLPNAPERQAPKPPSADELGEPTLIIVVVATLLTVVAGVWLLVTVTTTWVLVLVMALEIAGISASLAAINWQLSDGPGRRLEDRPPPPRGDSQVRSPRPSTPTT
jgi:hypothetical protein